MDSLNDLLALIKENAGNVATGIIGLLTTMIGYKVMFGKNEIDRAKVHADVKKIDLEEDRLSLERANAIDQRMDRLVAHLERQLEKQAAEAKQERDEMKKVMATQTREIRSLRDHIYKLTNLVRHLGGEPPEYVPTSETLD